MPCRHIPLQRVKLAQLIFSIHPGQLQPRFSSEEYSTSVGENVPVGTQLNLNIQATVFGSIQYSIHANVTAFSIDQNSGEISVVQSLDYETQNLYQFPVTAVTGSQGRSAEANVRIMVLDVNDNDPVFSQSIYNAILPFDEQSEWSFTVMATDADSGENGVIRYSFIDGNDAGIFTIKPRSGVIRVMNIFDPEIFPNFNLTVQAANQGSTVVHQGLATVLIDVETSTSTSTTAAPDGTTSTSSSSTSFTETISTGFAEATLHIRGVKPLLCTLLPSLAILLSILAALSM